MTLTSLEAVWAIVPNSPMVQMHHFPRADASFFSMAGIEAFQIRAPVSRWQASELPGQSITWVSLLESMRPESAQRDACAPIA
jgi:hypothetical protein